MTEGTLAAPYSPVEVSKVQQVFPAGVGPLMPAWDDIPDEFKHHRFMGDHWTAIVGQWFFRGLSEKTQFVPKPGIDAKVALAHLRTIMGSYEPKHEHKEAAVAYLMSLWFKKVKHWKVEAKASA